MDGHADQVSTTLVASWAQNIRTRPTHKPQTRYDALEYSVTQIRTRSEGFAESKEVKELAATLNQVSSSASLTQQAPASPSATLSLSFPLASLSSCFRDLVLHPPDGFPG